MSLENQNNLFTASSQNFLVGGGIPESLKPREIELPSESSFSRRGFLTKASVVVAGVVIAAPKADAAFFGLRNDKPVPGIPDAWVRAKGGDVMEYARHIQKLGLRNISPRMVLYPHFKTRGSVSNSLPPKSQWKNISSTLKVIDKMTTRIGSPLKDFISAYRSPRYNRAVGGARSSCHMRNIACDIQYSGVSPSHVTYIAKQLRSKGYFKGGVGRYSSFVHVDTRGTNASW